MYELIKHIIEKLGDFVGHKRCFLCHQSSLLLICQCCLADSKLPLFPVPGQNLLAYPKVYNNLLSPAYESFIALGRYEGVLKGLINQLKFSSKPLAAKVLAELFDYYLGPRIRALQNVPDALIPIPLSNTRHISRQYNQARLLSQELASRFGIQSVDGLMRTRHTKQQSRLSKKDRQTNISSAFAINNMPAFSSVAIVDDVVTTGATVNEACLTIQQAYPETSVSVWSIAATLR